jgi:hypothetical protein
MSTSAVSHENRDTELTELAMARRDIASIKEQLDDAENAQQLEFLATKLKIAYMTESAAQERELFTKKASIASDSGDHPASASGGKGLSALPSHFDTFKNYDFDKAESTATLVRDLNWIDQAMRLHYGKSPELNTHGPRQLVILLGPQNSTSIADIVARGTTWSDTMEILMALHAKEGRQELAFKKWKELEFFPGLETVEQYIKRYLSATKENFTVEKFDFMTSPFLGAHFAGTMPASVKKSLDVIIQMDKQTKLAHAEQQEAKHEADAQDAHNTSSSSAAANASLDTSASDPMQLARLRITLRPATLSAYFGFLRSMATGPDYGSHRRQPKEVNFTPFKDLEYYKLPGSAGSAGSSAASGRSTSNFTATADKSDKTRCTQNPCRHSCTFHHSNGHSTAECTVASKAKSQRDAGKPKTTIGFQERVPNTGNGAARPPVPSTSMATPSGHSGTQRPPTPRPADRSVSPSSTRTSPRGVPRVDYSNSGAGKFGGSKKLALLQSYDPSIQELALADGEEYGLSSEDDHDSSDEEDPTQEAAHHSFVAMFNTKDSGSDGDSDMPSLLEDSDSNCDSDSDLPPLIDIPTRLDLSRVHSTLPTNILADALSRALPVQLQHQDVPDLADSDDEASVTDQ